MPYSDPIKQREAKAKWANKNYRKKQDALLALDFLYQMEQ
jgi:hypothetical protein